MSFTRALHIFRGDRIFFRVFLRPEPPAKGSAFASASGRLPTPSGEEAFCGVNETAARVLLGREMNNVAIETSQPLETFSKYQGTDFTPY